MLGSHHSPTMASSASSEMDPPEEMPFKVDDFLALEEDPDPPTQHRPAAQHYGRPLQDQKHCHDIKNKNNKNAGSSSALTKSGGAAKVGFITRSDLEMLDDGYRWRKYGKKKVKSSPNPSVIQELLSVLRLRMQREEESRATSRRFKLGDNHI
ncbi:probable WRKY transcription factor 34 isoform X2 [Zingiber officinale]|uniref:probable WRKY transcription factor 34 isoform X2 n=1 Tax=Zingiber officinale TaxID=94328 RepID=UPI001C4C3217|nr:probable WRKY transcription factor 34 isoform X2 [Zingiber officinale]